nr:EAL domain-containing protein [Lachnospiraceae bacterium]
KDEWIMYGDFWYKSGEQWADRLLQNPDELPEAVVCANDCMAIGLARVFDRKGYKIPEDIAIAGFDASYEAKISPIALTSVEVPAFECGEYTYDYIKGQLDGVTIEPKVIGGKVIAGESCGCGCSDLALSVCKRDSWSTESSREGMLAAVSPMPDDLFMQDNILDYLNTIYSYAYQIYNIESFHLCLNKPWKYMDESYDIVSRNDGYSDKMIYAIRYNRDGKNIRVGLDEEFDTKLMLPELMEDKPYPTAYIFTPVFSEDENYGYSVINFGPELPIFDKSYRMWMGVVSRCFSMIRKKTMISLLKKETEKQRVSKFASGLNDALDKLSDEEKEELKLVENILDNNLLNYHFQPIVRTTDGSIFSYEALMRPATEKWISPLSVIKYANILNRINDVERATFLNVLSIVEEKKELFNNSKVFINSIPGVKISDKDFATVETMLKNNSDVAVVELTEEAELTDDELQNTKDFFKKLNIETAVDDYGTGYSNVSNLLRYMPNYVKIDRSLLSNIQNEPQKQHFVREIIEYCHSNDIMALAEGVETTEELQVVIHLGADLIQGYYTAKPNAEILPSIDEKVKNEIKRYRQERADGGSKEVYVAGKTNRISINTLIKDGYTDISIGEGNMVYNDVTIIGTPGIKSDIHVRVNNDYKGRITLENITFSNIKNRPTIELLKGSDVTMILKGENVLNNSGILVEEGAVLSIEGEGDLNINLDASEFYGIGNDLNSRHGDILFKHDGKIKVKTTGMKGVCIGSGKGGNIFIRSGQYIINATGEYVVGIGSYYSGISMDIESCLIEGEMSVTRGAFIGTVEGDADISIFKSRVDGFIGGDECVVVGTINGIFADVRFSEMSVEAGIRSDNSTCFGAVYGETEFLTDKASVTVEAIGKNSLAYGGVNKPTKVELIDTHSKINVHNSLGVETSAKDEDVAITNGRRKIIVNEKEIERKVEYKYDD